MTPEQRREYHKKKFSWGKTRGRKRVLTDEQKREKMRAASKAWYEKNREYRREYDRQQRMKRQAAKAPSQMQLPLPPDQGVFP